MVQFLRKGRMEASSSIPRHLCHLNLLFMLISRAHMLLHSIALVFLIHYRASFFFSETQNHQIPTSIWSLVFAAELVLAFIWALNQAARWKTVTRKVFPERLPEDEKLPAIDVFVCTADPTKEPTVDVMNTVLSAMALDYPPEKIHVYLSDDGSSPVTLFGMREAYAFAMWWLPFCRKYGLKTRCPKAYFGAPEEEENGEYASEKQKIRDKYELFKERVNKFRDQNLGDPSINGRSHSPVIGVIRANSQDDEGQTGQLAMPLLVYVSREKRPSYPHHFKAGALNVLLRVSGVMSNSPYILGLDCDMYSNDPSSARQAMCFHLDPKISPSLAFVQFPQIFRNISENDIYDSKLRSVFWVCWHGMDGLQGPLLSGTCYYLKREALYGKLVQDGTYDPMDLKAVFGGSNEFIKRLQQMKRPYENRGTDCWETSMVLREAEDLASCRYEDSTKWGKEVGFMYFSVVEDYFTSFTLHCKGWASVYLNPPRPQFLGTGTTNLNDLLVQGTRWSSGLIEVGLSRFCPLIYGLSTKISILEALAYAELSLFPLYFIPAWCFGVIPQLCLLHGIPLYPKVLSPYFLVFLFIFLSSTSKQVYEIIWSGHSLHTWVNERRHWMIKSVTCHMYGSMDAIMKKIGLREASFLPTNKVDDDEQTKLYEMGLFDFQAPAMFLIPLVGIVILNMFALVGGVTRALLVGYWEEIVVQTFLSIFILSVSYPIIEGMFLRKDKGSVPPRITVFSAIGVVAVLAFWNIFVSV
ncbi:cellulose synthase A catalytic subunit 1 [UDP-forming]-like [Punica granatum]|uniref:Cellulose synthase A catalytic subunit 1 [UDP-forming]-like n=3 Tax=Punica granatum TaxID=22663 RepID=A0A6P8C3M6_PUNGR|nr:cellulose synthase A catalytic subunit 1 [UDP-forming]-like [Punica granatum]